MFLAILLSCKMTKLVINKVTSTTTHYKAHSTHYCLLSVKLSASCIRAYNCLYSLVTVTSMEFSLLPFGLSPPPLVR